MMNTEKTHKIMSAIHSRNTKPELLLRKALWAQNCRYRINVKGIYGHPDIVVKKYKIAIFVDGDFWHGNNWKIRGLSSIEEELKSYSFYWREKIKRNIERDLQVTIQLRDSGWTVIRLWESDIYQDLNRCVAIILDAINRKKDFCQLNNCKTPLRF